MSAERYFVASIDNFADSRVSANRASTPMNLIRRRTGPSRSDILSSLPPSVLSPRLSLGKFVSSQSLCLITPIRAIDPSIKRTLRFYPGSASNLPGIYFVKPNRNVPAIRYAPLFDNGYQLSGIIDSHLRQYSFRRIIHS